MTVLNALRAELTAATNRLLTTTAALSGSDVTAPSLLPGWTRGHVLAHIARNADSHVNLVTWAKTGVYTPQYPTHEARETEIAEGAGRPAAEQHADIAASAARLDDAIASMPAPAWAATVGGLNGGGHPAWYILVRRIREVEIHHVDLDAGYTWTAWPEPFVWRELHDSMAAWPREQSPVGALHAGGRRWTGLGDGPAVEGPPGAVLAWVAGRLPSRDLGEVVRLRDEPAGRAEGDDQPGPGRLRLAGKPPAAPRWPATAPPGLPATPPEEYP
ncbi:maleylpyruvate isomerase N-terminal domain-containing protein [Sphaerisporangium sp. NPDC005289]|uniref:maleylpyruvate isomerase N-terminal domain-containing protein n=1 Tax=Sphaerisporangium sp. NPDC005289 TaxID=3155247 RepID=UPI0033A8B85C